MSSVLVNAHNPPRRFACPSPYPGPHVQQQLVKVCFLSTAHPTRDISPPPPPPPPLSIANRQPPTANCLLRTARCPLPTLSRRPATLLYPPTPLRQHPPIPIIHPSILFLFFTDFICFCAWRLALYALGPPPSLSPDLVPALNPGPGRPNTSSLRSCPQQ